MLPISSRKRMIKLNASDYCTSYRTIFATTKTDKYRRVHGIAVS